MGVADREQPRSGGERERRVPQVGDRGARVGASGVREAAAQLGRGAVEARVVGRLQPEPVEQLARVAVPDEALEAQRSTARWSATTAVSDSPPSTSTDAPVA